MSLRRFLNVAVAILVEEYQRMGVDLMSALEKVSEWAEGATYKPVADGTPKPQASARQNQAALSELSGMLSGVQGAPKRARRTKG